MDIDLFPLEQQEPTDNDNILQQTTNWPSDQPPADQDRQPSSTDPFVQVERYHELLPPLLQNEAFRLSMRMTFPPLTQHTEETDDGLFDYQQYLGVRAWVRDSLLHNEGIL